MMRAAIKFLRVAAIVLMAAASMACNAHWRAGYAFLWVMTPGGEVEEVGERPDYTSLDGWLAHPGLDDPADILPDGVSARRSRAAAFFVHPTSFITRSAWNQADPGQPDDMRDGVHIPNQAALFSTCCDVYAPRYRQATFFAFSDRGERGAQAIDLAYTDVNAAFDAFLQAVGPDRPIIVAGHSQGAAHVQRLLRERFNDPALRARLVVAAAPGYPIEAGDGGAVRPCERIDQAGCFLTWNIRRANAFIPGFFERVPVWDGDRYRPAGANPVCWDPGVGDPAARGYLGGFYIVPEGGPGPVLVETGAEGGCEEGWIVLDELADDRFAEVQLSGGWLHVYEYALAWNSLSDELAQRLQAWEAGQ